MPARIAIYAGTFDPITNGHMDIIRRALKVTDRLVVGVAEDTGKSPLFSLDVRTKLVEHDVKNLLGADAKRVEVKSFSGLLVNFADENGATLLVRGLRAVSDFEYEFQMACMNNKLSDNIETVFLTASETTHFVSSRFVKSIARLNGDVSFLVSPNVEKHLKKHYA
jgi:pantetheine-phosphate adenylyltransferase